MTYDNPSDPIIASSQSTDPRTTERGMDISHKNFHSTYSPDYFLNNHYSQREQDSGYSYLDGNTGYSEPDGDNSDYMTTSFILKDDEVPYHDPTCTVVDCQRPSCLIPDYLDDTSIPYHSLTSHDQSDQETECTTRSRSRSRHHKRHRHRSKSDMGSLNAPQQAPSSFRDAQEAPPTTEGVPDTQRMEKRPLSGSDVLRMSPR